MLIEMHAYLVTEAGVTEESEGVRAYFRHKLSIVNFDPIPFPFAAAQEKNSHAADQLIRFARSEFQGRKVPYASDDHH
jgi:hypothetical protein